MSDASDNMKGDDVDRLDAGRQFLADAVSFTRKADGFLAMLVQMERARTLCREYRDQGQPMTFTPIVVRACALALRKHPWVHWMRRGRRVVKPGTIDIGVSVAAKEAVTPVVVIREADCKTLAEVANKLREGSHEAKQKEPEQLARLRRWGRFIPAPVRTWMAKRFMRSQRARRYLAGTFQISNLSGEGVEFGIPFVLTTTALLSIGRAALRPVVVEGKVEARLCAYLTIAVDHRLVDGTRAWGFLADVKALLESPERLK